MRHILCGNRRISYCSCGFSSHCGAAFFHWINHRPLQSCNLWSLIAGSTSCFLEKEIVFNKFFPRSRGKTWLMSSFYCTSWKRLICELSSIGLIEKFARGGWSRLGAYHISFLWYREMRVINSALNLLLVQMSTCSYIYSYTMSAFDLLKVRDKQNSTGQVAVLHNFVYYTLFGGRCIAQAILCCIVWHVYVLDKI